jgi:hypothetical protein
VEKEGKGGGMSVAREISVVRGDLRPQFRLRRGRDDELIAWLASFAPRQRSEAIRRALCEHLVSRTNGEASAPVEDPDLAAALDALF